jgi:hypothetical protein
MRTTSDPTNAAAAAAGHARACLDALRSLPQAEDEYSRAEAALRNYPPIGGGRFVEVDGRPRRHPDDIAHIEAERQRLRQSAEDARCRVLLLREAVGLRAQALLPIAVPLGLAVQAVPLQRLVAAWDAAPSADIPTDRESFLDAVAFLKVLAVAAEEAEAGKALKAADEPGRTDAEDDRRLDLDALDVGHLQSLLSVSDLARRFRLPLQALRKRLERWRDDHDAGFSTSADRRRRAPTYLYQVEAVLPVLRELRRTQDGRASAVRPSTPPPAGEKAV